MKGDDGDRTAQLWRLFIFNIDERDKWDVNEEKACKGVVRPSSPYPLFLHSFGAEWTLLEHEFAVALSEGIAQED